MIHNNLVHKMRRDVLRIDAFQIVVGPYVTVALRQEDLDDVQV